MIIFIDFDNTLFNSTKLKEEIFNILASANISRDQFLEIYKKVHASGYTHRRFVKVLSIPNEKKVLQGLNKLTKDSSKFVYNDALWFINKYLGKAKLILVSWGDVFYQRKKILASGLYDYFDKVLLVNKKKYSILGKHIIKNENNYFINDNPIENREITQVFPNLKILTIKREDGKKYPDEEYQELKVYKDLREIEKIII